jgi:CopY/TcrY family copper transport repressor
MEKTCLLFNILLNYTTNSQSQIVDMTWSHVTLELERFLKGEFKMSFQVSDAELVVMRGIWSLGQATVDDLACFICDENDWSVATLKTLLGRLVKKGMLETEKSGRKFIYRPTVDECSAVMSLADDLLDKINDQRHADLCTAIFENAKLTQADLEKLKQLLNDKSA